MFQITEQGRIKDSLDERAFLEIWESTFSLGNGIDELTWHPSFFSENISVSVMDFVTPDPNLAPKSVLCPPLVLTKC